MVRSYVRRYTTKQELRHIMYLYIEIIHNVSNTYIFTYAYVYIYIRMYVATYIGTQLSMWKTITIKHYSLKCKTAGFKITHMYVHMYVHTYVRTYIRMEMIIIIGNYIQTE